MKQGGELWLSHLRENLVGGCDNPYLLAGLAPLESKPNILLKEAELRWMYNFALPKKLEQALKMLTNDDFKRNLDQKIAKVIIQKCAYHGLELEPLDDSDASQINAIFRRLSLTHHPDKGGDPTKFLEMSESRSRLLDEVFRAFEDSVLKDAIRVIGQSEAAVAAAAAPAVAPPVVAAAPAPVVAAAPAPNVAAAPSMKQSSTEIANSTSNLGEEKGEACDLEEDTKSPFVPHYSAVAAPAPSTATSGMAWNCLACSYVHDSPSPICHMCGIVAPAHVCLKCDVLPPAQVTVDFDEDRKPSAVDAATNLRNKKRSRDEEKNGNAVHDLCDSPLPESRPLSVWQRLDRSIKTTAKREMDTIDLMSPAKSSCASPTPKSRHVSEWERLNGSTKTPAKCENKDVIDLMSPEKSPRMTERTARATPPGTTSIAQENTTIELTLDDCSSTSSSLGTARAAPRGTTSGARENASVAHASKSASNSSTNGESSEACRLEECLEYLNQLSRHGLDMVDDEEWKMKANLVNGKNTDVRFSGDNCALSIPIFTHDAKDFVEAVKTCKPFAVLVETLRNDKDYPHFRRRIEVQIYYECAQHVAPESLKTLWRLQVIYKCPKHKLLANGENLETGDSNDPVKRKACATVIFKAALDEYAPHSMILYANGEKTNAWNSRPFCIKNDEEGSCGCRDWQPVQEVPAAVRHIHATADYHNAIGVPRMAVSFGGNSAARVLEQLDESKFDAINTVAYPHACTTVCEYGYRSLEEQLGSIWWKIGSISKTFDKYWNVVKRKYPSFLVPSIPLLDFLASCNELPMVARPTQENIRKARAASSLQRSRRLKDLWASADGRRRMMNSRWGERQRETQSILMQNLMRSRWASAEGREMMISSRWSEAQRQTQSIVMQNQWASAEGREMMISSRWSEAQRELQSIVMQNQWESTEGRKKLLDGRWYGEAVQRYASELLEAVNSSNCTDEGDLIAALASSTPIVDLLKICTIKYGSHFDSRNIDEKMATSIAGVRVFLVFTPSSAKEQVVECVRAFSSIYDSIEHLIDSDVRQVLNKIFCSNEVMNTLTTHVENTESYDSIVMNQPVGSHIAFRGSSVDKNDPLPPSTDEVTVYDNINYSTFTKRVKKDEKFNMKAVTSYKEKAVLIGNDFSKVTIYRVTKNDHELNPPLED